MRLLSKVLQVPSPPKTRHYIGFPAGVPGQETGKLMETPDILLIEESKDGTFLYRYTASGKNVGDTWHASVEDAKHQADFEFAGLITPWVNVPPEITNVVEYALGEYRF
jgi:hypothetical protein